MARQGLALPFAMPLTIALLLLGGNAFADMYTIDVTGVDGSRGESIWIYKGGANVSQYFVGVGLITLNDTTAQTTWNRDTLCVDLFTDIYIGTTYGTTVLSPAAVSGRNLSRAAWLVNNAVPPAGNANFSSQLPPSDWVTTAAQGAGLQLAIWDITIDDGDGLSNGLVRASSDPANPTPTDVIDWATNYEALSLNQASYSAFVYSNYDGSTPVQMLIGPEYTNGPAPATFSIGNRVFYDNGAGGGIANNGIQDGTEPGIANIAMKLFAADGSGNPTGSVLATTITDANGYYRFDGLLAGTYVVVVDVVGSGTNLDGMNSSTGWSTNTISSTNIITPTWSTNTTGKGGWSTNLSTGDLSDHGKDAVLGGLSVLPGGIASVPVTVGIGLQPTNEVVFGSGAGAHGPTGDTNDNLVMDFGFFTPSPSAAVMAWLGAYVDTNGQVRVTWKTLSEDDLLYLDVQRSASSSAGETDVTPDWVEAQGGQALGFLYQVPDSTAVLPGRYTYRLMAYYNDGSSEELANVTVTLATVAKNAGMGAIRITGLQAQTNGMLVQWIGGQPPYTLESQTGPGAVWTPVGPAQPGETEAVVPAKNASGLFRVKGGE